MPASLVHWHRVLQRSGAALLGVLALCATGCLQTPHGSTTAHAGTPLEIVLLTTNDLHGRLEPFLRQPARDARPVGGFAGLAAGMQQIERREHGAVLRLNSGDTLIGPYSIHCEGDVLFGALALMGIDAATPGNHEFDRGPSSFARALRHCPFPMVATNLVATPGHALAGSLTRYCLIERGGARVLILGIMTPELYQISNPGPDIRIWDPANPQLRTYINSIIARHAPDLVVALSHLGLEGDRRLAIYIPRIDVICGGHSHDLLPSGQEIRIRHADGRQTVIVQAGSGGGALGVLRVRSIPGSRPEYDWQIQENSADRPRNRAMTAFIHASRARLPSRVLTVTDKALDCRSATLRTREAPIGSYISDSLRTYFNADAALYNGGGIRGDCVVPAGTLTTIDIETMLPFDNRAVLVGMTGVMLRQALERSVARLPHPWGGFLQVSGLRIYVDPTIPAGTGRRVTHVKVLGTDGHYHPLDPEQHYRIATNTYLAAGGNGYEEFSNAPAEQSTEATVRDIVMLRLASRPRYGPADNHRITVSAPAHGR